MVYSPTLGLDFYVLASGVVRVMAITIGSAAAEDGRISKRDVLLTFNGILLGGLPLHKAREILGVIQQGSVIGMHFLDGAAYDSLGTGVSLQPNVALGQHCFFVCLMCDSAVDYKNAATTTLQDLFEFTDMSKFKQGLASNQSNLSVSSRRLEESIPAMFPLSQPRRATTVRASAVQLGVKARAHSESSAIFASPSGKCELEEILERASRTARKTYKQTVEARKSMQHDVITSIRNEAYRKACTHKPLMSALSTAANVEYRAMIARERGRNSSRVEDVLL